MVQHHWRFAGKLWAVALAVVVTGPLTRAQDEGASEDNADADAPVAQVRDLEEQFDVWVFGSAGDATKTRDQLRSRLSVQLAAIDRLCRLSDDQRRKLEMAGRAGIKRYFDRVDEKRRELKLDAGDPPPDVITRIAREGEEMRPAHWGELFGEGTLFAKILPRTLSEGQRVRYDEGRREARLFRIRAQIESSIATLDIAIGFNESQRRRLEELFLEEALRENEANSCDIEELLVRAAEWPEAKIRPLFDEAQWRALDRIFLSIRQGKPGGVAEPMREAPVSGAVDGPPEMPMREPASQPPAQNPE